MEGRSIGAGRDESAPMGGWMKANPIPAEYSSWGTFTELRDNNLTALHTILEAAAKANAPANSNEQKIGDFYSSCMDTTAIEAQGIKPIASDLAAIDAINDRNTLDAEIARLHREGANVVFNFSSGQDYKDSSRVIALAGQGGLGMPDRDYYLRDDDKDVPTGWRCSREGHRRSPDGDGHRDGVGEGFTHAR